MKAERIDVPPAALGQRVRQAVIWRSGSQVVAQAIAWGSTFLVIRLLDPADYGLFAMTQVMLVFFNLMNGYGIANALIRAETVSRQELRQVFGLLILLNGGLALVQFVAAPLVAGYYRQPMVADILRVQAVLYLATPFIALSYAMLSRQMDFKRPAQVRLVAAVVGAITALYCALSGWGVWTLVAAPIAMFSVEAVGMTWAARSLMWPSFRFRGAEAALKYGGAMTLVQFFWFLQSQADVFIAGRVLDPHTLGTYTTALFLTQILASKFVPPLNDVAFAAYSRMQSTPQEMRGAFLKTVRLILLIAMPAYFGLAVTAEPLVATVLGEKWLATAEIVPILAMAMPLLTLQILFAPATNATGRAGVAVRAAITGGAVLPMAFLVGIQFGVAGLAWAWLGGMVVLVLVTAALSLPALGIPPRDLARAVAPSLVAAVAMAALVAFIDSQLPPLAAPARTFVLVCLGAAAYLGILLLVARGALREAVSLVRGREASV